jgi:predicted alpha/beta hydrolase family esterase
MTLHAEQATAPTTVFVPGMREATSEHWQAILAARLPGAREVPPLGRTLREVSAHVAALQDTLSEIAGPVILVAHSAGVITTVHWASRHRGHVVGALLATPPDLVTPLPAAYPSLDQLAEHGWLPVPTDPLPFPSILATSADDPLSDPTRVSAFGAAWGSDVRDVGAVGHLNPASGYGEWPDARRLLEELLDLGSRSRSVPT